MRGALLHILVAVTVVGTTPAGGAILCVGNDGHGAIELAGADCCDPVTRSPGALDARCTDDCRDTPIVTSGAVAPTVRAASPAVHSNIVTVAVGDLGRTGGDSGAAFARTLRLPAHPPRLLRTAVQLL